MKSKSPEEIWLTLFLLHSQGELTFLTQFLLSKMAWGVFDCMGREDADSLGEETLTPWVWVVPPLCCSGVLVAMRKI